MLFLASHFVNLFSLFVYWNKSKAAPATAAGQMAFNPLYMVQLHEDDPSTFLIQSEVWLSGWQVQTPATLVGTSDDGSCGLVSEEKRGMNKVRAVATRACVPVR